MANKTLLTIIPQLPARTSQAGTGTREGQMYMFTVFVAEVSMVCLGAYVQITNTQRKIIIKKKWISSWLPISRFVFSFIWKQRWLVVLSSPCVNLHVSRTLMNDSTTLKQKVYGADAITQSGLCGKATAVTQDRRTIVLVNPLGCLTAQYQFYQVLMLTDFMAAFIYISHAGSPQLTPCSVTPPTPPQTYKRLTNV